MSMTFKPITTAVLVVALAAMALAAAAPALALGAPRAPTSAYVRGKVVVGYSSPASAASIERATRLSPTSSPAPGVRVLRLPPNESVPAAIARLRALKGVAYAVPD